MTAFPGISVPELMLNIAQVRWISMYAYERPYIVVGMIHTVSLEHDQASSECHEADVYRTHTHTHTHNTTHTHTHTHADCYQAYVADSNSRFTYIQSKSVPSQMTWYASNA